MLEIRNVIKYYDRQLLLNNISFTLADEEILCLLGPSGGGKSTLLRIIAGLEEMESGRVLWDGQDLANVPAHERAFGLMFQDYALFPHMTVSQNIAFGLRMQGVDNLQIRKRVEEALQMVDLRDFENRKVFDLSGGEQQRVALARALLPRPRLLMLDEPLGALDRALREQLGSDLRRVLDQMKTPVIYVTHDQEEAFAIADRLMVLHKGGIIQSGAPQEIFRQPDTLWLATFFGQKNHLHGRVLNLQPMTVETNLAIFICENQKKEFFMHQSVTLVLPNSAAEAGGQDKNSFLARVQHVRFQGIGFMIDFLLQDGSSMRFFFDRALQVGQEISLCFQPQSILCYA